VHWRSGGTAPPDTANSHLDLQAGQLRAFEAREIAKRSAPPRFSATSMPFVIQIKRVYDSHAPADGARFLVERLWPRGITKASLDMDDWLKDAAPSAELRRWFNHESAKWSEFQRRYRAELDAHPDGWKPILIRARRGPVTLLYSAHDVEHNNAVVLRDYLNAKLKAR